MCDDTSSELQRMAAIERREINSQNSLRGRGALSRYVNWWINYSQLMLKSSQMYLNIVHSKSSSVSVFIVEKMSWLLPWVISIVYPSILLCRIVSMVMTLREWAQKSLSEETERPDSFLERFRGPAHNDMQAAPSRFSHSCTGSDADNEIRRSGRRQGWKCI